MATHDGSATDIGVLSSEEYEDDTLLFGKNEERFLKSNSQSPVCNPKQIVECDNGFTADGKTCEEACDGLCCTGDDFVVNSTLTLRPCDYFTGSLCKDRISCSGARACAFANTNSVVRSCNGPVSCYKAGYNGYVGSIINSCHDQVSCTRAGSYGTIGSIVNSCLGAESCRSAARSGIIASIVNSCNGTNACYYAAAFGGLIEEIDNSCMGDEACKNAARRGSIGSIMDSCQGGYSCLSIANNGGIEKIVNSCKNGNGILSCSIAASGGFNSRGYIKSIVNSCYGGYSCLGAGSGSYRVSGYIGPIYNSCLEEGSCRYAAKGGYITAITKSCQGADACYEAANQGSIGGVGILNSCLEEGACRDAAKFQGYIGAIKRSCQGENACRDAAYQGSITAIAKSCNGKDACRDAANQGSIGGVGILNACQAFEACVGLAKINTTKASNCTEGAQQVYPYCPTASICTQETPSCSKVQSDFDFCLEKCGDFECLDECLNSPAYNCTEGAQQVYPYCPLDCSGTQEPPYCPLLSDRTYNITSGLKKCCNEAESCKNIGDDLPDDCIEKKNVVPWQKGKKDKGRE